MNNHVPELLDACTGLKVVVLGDAILDGYLEGTSGRLCREAPVPVVAVSQRKYAPGGAGNTAVNVATLGGQVALLSVLGEDVDGDLLQAALVHYGVSTEHLIRQRARRTLAKHRVIADSHMLVRFDEGNHGPLDGETEWRVMAHLAELFQDCDALIVSDYGYGVLTPRIIKVLGELQAGSPRVLVIDSRHQLGSFRKVGGTAVKPNYAELLQLLGDRDSDSSKARADLIASWGDRILDLTGAQLAAVTIDVEGALFFERGRPPYRTYARPIRQARAAGAGDTFTAALALALAAGAHTPAAAELASAAAAVVVGKDGTAACSAQEVRAYLSPAGKYIPGRERLAAQVEFHRQQGRRIVFTNGCFDILHRGHIMYLNHAKALGDVLIVGVNSDLSVQRLKGPGRPVNPLSDRIQVLSALSCIDYVTPFEGDTPADLLQAVRPDVYVKGGDYTRETLPEATLVEELGGSVQFLPYVEDQSTSGIIERIRKSACRDSNDQRSASAEASLVTPPGDKGEPQSRTDWNRQAN